MGAFCNVERLAFVDATGHVFRHDKDIPTMVESAFYVGGTSDRLLQTGVGRVGVAMCWEMIRTRTVMRLANEADLIMAGTHWWTEPGWRFPRRLLAKAHQRNLRLLTDAPRRLARMTGAPVIHASQVGRLEGRFALTRSMSVPMTTMLLGQSQIVSSRGDVLASRSAEDGEGLLMAEIDLGNAGASMSPRPGFWNTALPWETRALWWHQNHVCAARYPVLS